MLTPANVGGSSGAPSTFGQLSTVALDGQVNAQPLVVPNVHVVGDPNPGNHDVVYVVTVGNTIYAIDPTAGTILLSRNLGTPVGPAPSCGSPPAGVGILSTPVIDLSRGWLYLIAYTQDATGPTYRLHALSLTTLADAIPPVVVAATQTLTNGSSYAFDAAHLRQRPALLEANNAIYAGFGAFCDVFASLARGWVLGWTADTLQPLNISGSGQPTGELTNRLAAAPTNRFLSSVWMSGAGLAADTQGVYFITGNADASGTTYDGINAVENSVIKIGFSTAVQLDLFTPSNVAVLDQQDQDFSSGGIMLLPSLGASVPPLATAAGKIGTLYLLNRNNLGGYTPGGPDKVYASENVGRCWCIEVILRGTHPDRGQQRRTHAGAVAGDDETGHRPEADRLNVRSQVGTRMAGFFTSVSSNGSANAIIWAVLRPTTANPNVVSLAAYAATTAGGKTTLKQLYSAPAGTWPAPNSNSDIVPVVANGRVYVASNQQLAIFGLNAPAP